MYILNLLSPSVPQQKEAPHEAGLVSGLFILFEEIFDGGAFFGVVDTRVVEAEKFGEFV